MRPACVLLLVLGCSHSPTSERDLAVSDLSGDSEDLAAPGDLAAADRSVAGDFATDDSSVPPDLASDMTAPRYQVTVTIRSVYGADGTVGSDIGGISCPDTCSANYSTADPVTLTASPAPGALFQSWSGSACADRFAATCTPNPAGGNVQLTATFRPPVNYMFITSHPITVASIGGDFSGADAFCDQAARSAGLWNTSGTLPSRFKAWLATQSVPAPSRLAGARGWIRVDGREFADDLINRVGQNFYPPNIDENGRVASTSAVTGTGSNLDGTVDWFTPTNNSDCNDWVSPVPTPAPNGAGQGDPTAGNYRWTLDQFGADCTGAWALYCFETAYNVAVSPSPTPSPSPGPRAAFATFWTPGGGLASADAQCQSDKGALPGNYLALLATTTASAASRFTDGLPWARPDGALVAATAADLLAGKWIAPIILGSDGVALIGSAGQVWNGAKSIGAVAPNMVSSCNDWSSTAPSGLVGVPDLALFFSGYVGTVCSQTFAIYCLQQ